jgi:hypothetical protein
LTKVYRDYQSKLRQENIPIPDHSAWRSYAATLASRRVNPARMMPALRRAAFYRRLFEDGLENHVRLLADEEYVRRLKSRARRFKQLLALLPLLNEMRFLPKDLPGEIAYQLKEHLRAELAISSPTLTPRHRPSEVWLYRPVADLVLLFPCKTPWRFRIRSIHKGLELFGHCDVVKLETVHHIVRRLRKLDTRFS